MEMSGLIFIIGDLERVNSMTRTLFSQGGIRDLTNHSCNQHPILFVVEGRITPIRLQYLPSTSPFAVDGTAD